MTPLEQLVRNHFNLKSEVELELWLYENEIAQYSSTGGTYEVSFDLLNMTVTFNQYAHGADLVSSDHHELTIGIRLV